MIAALACQYALDTVISGSNILDFRVPCSLVWMIGMALKKRSPLSPLCVGHFVILRIKTFGLPASRTTRRIYYYVLPDACCSN